MSLTYLCGLSGHKRLVSLSPHLLVSSSPRLLTLELLIPAKLVGYITCKWEGQHPAVIAMDTWHGHTHTSYILAGPVLSVCVRVCVIVHVSEVGQQQQRYLTHPEKTSVEFKQPSHWLQLPVCARKTINNTHAAIRPCCIRTSAGMRAHTHIHQHLGQILAAWEQKFQHTHHIHRCAFMCTKTVQWVFTTLSEVKNVCFFYSVLYCTQSLTLFY